MSRVEADGIRIHNSYEDYYFSSIEPLVEEQWAVTYLELHPSVFPEPDGIEILPTPRPPLPKYNHSIEIDKLL